MWFKNLILYRFNKAFNHSQNDLEEQLAAAAFVPCGSQDMDKMGWDTPLGRNSSNYLHAAQGCYLICARKQEKILPAAVINELLEEKVLDIEQEQDRRVSRKERANLRDDLIQELLPKAFTRSGRIYAIIAPKQGLLLVDAGSAKKAEDLCSLLRNSLGSLPVIPPQVIDDPATILSAWLQGENVPNDIVLEDSCDLIDPEVQGAVIRARKMELESDEIHGHLKAGKQVAKLGLCWNERVSFTLSHELELKGLKYSDLIQEEVMHNQGDDGDTAAELDASFFIMSQELLKLVQRIFTAFGGEVEPDLGLS